MKVLLFSFLGGLFLPMCLFAQEAGLDANLQNPGYIEEPEWFKESFLDIREDIQDAAAENKRVLLYFHQDGCPYCEKLIKDNFGQRETTELTQSLFDTISINLWGDREVIGFNGDELTEKEFSKSLRVQFTPTLLMLDENGEVALRVNGYYPPGKFQAALHYGGGKLEEQGSFRDYLASTPVANASGKLHTNPTYLNAPLKLRDTLQSSTKPMLVMFEQKQCLACDELHTDILQREESLKLLNGFDVALVDMWSATEIQTPDGQVKKIRQWADDLGVAYAPTMAFFDANGHLIFRTDAYLRAFHTDASMAYVLEKAYLTEPEFQRFVESRADSLRALGIEVNLME